MKPIFEQATTGQPHGEVELGPASVTLNNLSSDSVRIAPFVVWLRWAPTTDRERSSPRARRAPTPASDLRGGVVKEITRSEEANREWFIWRFGEDA